MTGTAVTKPKASGRSLARAAGVHPSTMLARLRRGWSADRLMTPPQNLIWPAERIERLRALWLAGHSAGEVGRTLRLTKNSVIGALHRLGLSAADRPTRIALPNPTAGKPAAKARWSRTPKRAPHQSPFPQRKKTKADGPKLSKPPPALPKDRPEDLEIPLEQRIHAVADLRSGCCRWIVGRLQSGGFYLRGLKGSWGLKPFNGITTAPLLSNDGSIRVAQGYDPASGMWCHNIPVVDVPHTPSQEQAEAALRYIRQRFRTFPFADSARVRDDDLGVDVVNLEEPAGLDESSFVVMLLTAVCRQSLELAPGCLCNAPSFSGAGTGKGLLIKAMCIIASGARPSAFTGGHDDNELDKRLTASLVEARPAIFLDNYNAKQLASDILASALTENPAMVRIMGKTVNVPLNVRTFIGHHRERYRNRGGHGATHHRDPPRRQNGEPGTASVQRGLPR